MQNPRAISSGAVTSTRTEGVKQLAEPRGREGCIEGTV